MQSRPRAHEIRRRFLDFFAGREHAVVPSSSLVPSNDPTLLFTNAGMVQFKDTFLGRDPRPYQRAVSVQRCLRAGGKHNDLDNVGFTDRHHTLFEMLGNFSFGDYFKQDAIRWGWEFLTQDLGIPAEKLVVSVFSGEGESAPADDEAFQLWTELLPADRIYRLPAKENFWAMGDTGPCGPCSEIHIFHGDRAPGDATREGKVGPAYEDTRYTELWNLVFMQYEKLADGSLRALPRPSIDTGAGLERLAAVMEGVGSNYRTSLLTPLVDLAKRLAGASADDLGAGESPFRVIADHARATAFLIADGVFPDKAGRSYVLRRIMRRAIRYGNNVGLEKSFFHEVCRKVVEEFGDAYPLLVERQGTIDEVVRIEEDSFRRTLTRGLKRLEAALTDLGPQQQGAFPAAVAADLYDTYGFPVDVTGIIVKEKGLTLDEDAVEAAIRQRQSQDGAAASSLGSDKAIGDLYFKLKEKHAPTATFSGYAETSGVATVLALAVDGKEADEAHAGAQVEFIVDRTPFYAESGGQVGDTGRALADGLELTITDTHKPTGDVHVHRGELHRGSLRVGQQITLEVDVERRAAIRRNHSATHLLHHALRAVLGTHVAQKGSLVGPDRLRFDFSHTRPLTLEQRQEIERRVNADVLRNQDSVIRSLSMDDARKTGAIGLFEAKYGEVVRVINIGSESVELCGGTHVARAGDIGLFAILSEGGIAQGVRRIEAVTGMNALAYLQQTAQILGEAATQLHASGPQEVLGKLERLRLDYRARERDISDLQRKLTTGGGGAGDTIEDVGGIKLLAKLITVGDPKAMREAVDALRDRLGSGVVVLGAEREGKAALIVAVTKDLSGKIHAGNLIAAIAGHVEGRGGGRPDLAQAGGANPAGLPQALAAARDALAAQLGS